jgi:hypothetical protein
MKEVSGQDAQVYFLAHAFRGKPQRGNIFALAVRMLRLR